MVNDVITTLASAVLAANVAIVLFLLLLLHSRLTGKESGVLKIALKKINEYGVRIAFVVALVSTAGSLFLSEVAGFVPCVLCWYQRVLMYPLVFITGAAIVAGDRNIRRFVLPMSVVGVFTSAYHYYLQNNPNPLVPCSTIGFSVSCSERYSTTFGFITIPYMAFTGFVAITLLIYFTNAKVGK